LKVIVSNAHWFWFCAFNHDMSRKLLIEILIVLYWTFWVQVLLKFLISNDKLNKKLIKSNMFMFFDSNFIEISDFESRFFFRNFWFLLSFLNSSSDLSYVTCFYIIYTSIARLMSFELMLWVCIKRIIWVYSN